MITDFFNEGVMYCLCSAAVNELLDELGRCGGQR